MPDTRVQGMRLAVLRTDVRMWYTSNGEKIHMKAHGIQTRTVSWKQGVASGVDDSQDKVWFCGSCKNVRTRGTGHCCLIASQTIKVLTQKGDPQNSSIVTQ